MNAIEQAKSALELISGMYSHDARTGELASAMYEASCVAKSALAALSAPAQMTDAEILEAVKPFTEEADGGFACITGARQIVAAFRAIESRALSSAAGQEPVAWIVFDETGPAYCAGYESACHEHINDAINQYDILDAAKWKVCPVYAAPAKPQEPVAAQQDLTWQQAERIRDAHEVDMALENFSHDSTADNATGLVLAVMKATAAHPAQAPQQEAGQARELPQQEPERMTIDQSREYLVKFMEQHFTDRTFHRYIRGELDSVNLAGDFAWQMARALRLLASAPAPAQPTVPVAYGLFWQLDDADYLQFPVFPTREECEAEIQSYGEGDRARMIVRPLAIAAAAPVAQGSKEE